MTHICVSNLTTIGSDNGLSPVWRQVVIWTNAGILLIGPEGTNVSEILIAIQTFSFKKMLLKAERFCPGGYVSTCSYFSLTKNTNNGYLIAPMRARYGVYVWSSKYGLPFQIAALCENIFRARYGIPVVDLTHKQREMNGCMLSAIAIDALMLKHQAISKYSALKNQLYWTSSIAFEPLSLLPQVVYYIMQYWTVW